MRYCLFLLVAGLSSSAWADEKSAYTEYQVQKQVWEQKQQALIDAKKQLNLLKTQLEHAQQTTKNKAAVLERKLAVLKAAQQSELETGQAPDNERREVSDARKESNEAKAKEQVTRTTVTEQQGTIKQFELALDEQRGKFKEAIDKSLKAEFGSKLKVTVSHERSCGSDALPDCRKKAFNEAREKALVENTIESINRWNRVNYEGGRYLLEKQTVTERLGKILNYRELEAKQFDEKYAVKIEAEVEGDVPSSLRKQFYAQLNISSAPEVSAEVEVVDSDGIEPEMVKIPAGSFMMGEKSDAHKVSVNAFQMSKYEITRGQFAVFVNDTKYSTEAEKEDGCYGWSGSTWEKKKEFSWRNVGFSQEDTHPVVCVSWNDAVAYSAWLSKKTGKAYRLPTEAEWEYAARAGTTTERYWGDDADKACVYANVYDKTAKSKLNASGEHNCEDAYVFTAPVGKKKENGFGLYDMLGNVWEWTCSESGAYSDKKETVCNQSVIGRRVVRGGSWGSGASYVRSANRNYSDSTNRDDELGFRLISVP